MTNKNTRRTILKLVGTTTLIGVTGQVSARSNSTPSESEKQLVNQALPYDLNVRNNTSQAIEVSVEFEGRNDMMPATTENLQLGPHLEQSDAIHASLDIPEGEYTLNILLDGESAETASWAIPPGGIPDWIGLTIMVFPDKEIKIFKEEA